MKSRLLTGRDIKNLLPSYDAFELDPREISWGLELGNGEFGTVFIGEVNGKKVAIKKIKGTSIFLVILFYVWFLKTCVLTINIWIVDNSQYSLKEDLLREIEFMKKLGPHPNIVGLIKASTLNDPVAIVMEYMPYGNLQTFLR